MWAFSDKNMEWAVMLDHVSVRLSIVNMQNHDADHAVKKLVAEWY